MKAEEQNTIGHESGYATLRWVTPEGRAISQEWLDRPCLEGNNEISDSGMNKEDKTKK